MKNEKATEKRRRSNYPKPLGWEFEQNFRP